jgi:hypothetical protein
MRYSAEGPTGNAAAGSPSLGSALLPVPARDARSYQSWGEVVGEIGQAVAAPYPEAVYQDRSHRALHRSSDAPPSWIPEPYYQPRPAAVPQVARESDNQLPIPAKSTVGGQMANIAARRAQFLRQRQVGWPYNTPKFAWRA